MSLRELLELLPAAAVTLLAAVIAGTVAITVATINAHAARRQARENAQREFRKSVVQVAIDTSRSLYLAVVRCSARIREDESQAINEFRNDMVAQYYWRIGIPGARDPILNRAMTVYDAMRSEVLASIHAAPPEKLPEHVKSLSERCFEVVELVQVASEGYMFDSQEARRAARAMLQAKSGDYEELEGKQRARNGFGRKR